MTPMSMTSKPLQARTTPTMFLPMSWTSPFTVAMSTRPADMDFSTFDAGVGFGEVGIFFAKESGLSLRHDVLFLFGLHERFEVGHGFFHDAGGFDDLREEHFSGSEEVADDTHAVHEGAFDDLQGVFRIFGGLPRCLRR